MPTGCPHGTEPMEDVPMNRYTNPIPVCCPKQSAPCAVHPEDVDHILTALACQNQILTDLLGAVNGLTAAILYKQR